MSWDEIFKFVGASIFSVLPAGAVIAGLSTWLGKVWAERILARETNELKRQLSESQHKLEISLKQAERELDFLKDSRSRIHNDKIGIYRGVVDMVAKLLASFDAMESSGASDADMKQQFHNFNEQRIRLYGYMAMFAPQAVIDAQDALIDHLLLVAHGQATYVWSDVRELALSLINEIRIDVGVDKSPIVYNGQL